MCGMCAGVCGCAQVCPGGVRRCVRVFAGVHKCARVCAGMHGCSVGGCGCGREYANVCRCARVSTGVRDCARVCIDLHRGTHICVG